ncbi:transporter substrate-binding domain-containing protein [Spiribacter insolitus]|uniref:Transporter substrate-binding domain-containing protein n=1 Tax=Spiribacter insolitus TaxID=3122417 RepID=A0ABV3T6Q0_9GAMM
MTGNRNEESWPVGILFSQTGVTAIIEQSQLNGALLAIDEINEAGGAAGRPISPIILDPASDPVRYRTMAEELLGSLQTNVIFGCYMSSSRKEVLPVVERYNGLLFYPTLYEGFEYSPNVIYGGAAPNQNSLPLAMYLMDNFGSRFYFVGSDYIYPRESNRVMRNIVRQGGGEVVAEKYVDLSAGPEDFAPIIQHIAEVQPDVVFSTVVGTGTVNFYRAYHEAGGDGLQRPIASLTTNEAEVAAMGNASAQGHITAAPYFRNIVTRRNMDFLARYQAKFGEVETVTSACEAAYFQVHLYANALRLAGAGNTDQLRSVLRGAEFEAPQGRIKVDPDNNHAYLLSRIARVDDQGEFILEREASRPIKPDPYLAVPALNDWANTPVWIR